MKRYCMGVLALAGWFAVAESPQTASAQRVAKNVYQSQAPMSGQRPGPTRVEELPPGRVNANQVPANGFSDPFADEPYGQGEFRPYPGHSGEYFPGGGYPCGDGCCEPTQYVSLCDADRGQFFFTADYIYVSANFSQADAYYERNANVLPVERTLHQLDFDYTSSYRIGGGYRLCGCGDEVRFLYSRLRSDTGALEVPIIDNQTFIPLEPELPPLGGVVEIDASVDLKSYDLECAKIIPICSSTCCDCGDPCGGECGDCCKAKCPEWDLIWSGGLRVADADWQRSYTTFDDNDIQFGQATSRMDFEGVGAKIGLEGRRYFFATGWLSAHLKGDISLLLGDVEHEIVRTVDGGAQAVTVQTFETRSLIPVTELEAGLSAQVTCNARVSAGYLLSAWHDLGFRDEFETDAQSEFPVSYDDANILGFDGFFARFEWAY